MKKILISADPYETRVAMVEDNRVVETYLERDDRRSMLGNVYRAKVDNVLPGMEAAFLDLGLPKNGFLYVNEIVIPELDDSAKRKRRIEQLIRPGQELMVQITKDPMKTKGARVTMQLSFAGRFLVYTPDGTGFGVSKRLEDDERERLRKLVKGIAPKGGGGLIVRTAARGANREELERDLALLEEQWRQISERYESSRAPALVHEEVDLALEMVRDDLRVDVDEVVTDDEATFERIRAYVGQHSPTMLDRVKLHTAATPLMRRYQVDEAIQSTLLRRVDLPSGGYLLFDYAEAFTVIDVNTGRFVGTSKLEDTILANNLEAATEVLRQLRLRDIGGIIIIDFVDMAAAKNRQAVIDRLNRELAKDRSKVYLTSISPLGLVEMTRQNVTDGVREILTAQCPTCHGEGIVMSDESLAIENLRALRRHARLSVSQAFLVEVHPRIASLMIGQGGRRLAELERATGKHFSLVSTESVPVERCAVVREGAVADVLQQAIPVVEGQEIDVVLAEPHMYQAADAVARIEGGYRLVIAGGGAYLGQTHRVRVNGIGRLEAHATLLTAEPVSEQQMLATVDRRPDIAEPERGLMERMDLSERRRGRGGPSKPVGGEKPQKTERAPQKRRDAKPAEPAVQASPAPTEPASAPVRSTVTAPSEPTGLFAALGLEGTVPVSSDGSGAEPGAAGGRGRGRRGRRRPAEPVASSATTGGAAASRSPDRLPTRRGRGRKPPLLDLLGR